MMSLVLLDDVLTILFRADELGVNVNMPNQIRWGFGGRGAKSAKSALEIPELIGTA